MAQVFEIIDEIARQLAVAAAIAVIFLMYYKLIYLHSKRKWKMMAWLYTALAALLAYVSVAGYKVSVPIYTVMWLMRLVKEKGRLKT